MNTNHKPITERAMLAALSISQWSARKHDKRVSREVAEYHHTTAAASEVGRYNKILVNKDAIKPIQAIANKARIRHDYLTLPWSDSGYRILSAEGFLSYAEEMRTFKDEFRAAVTVFVAEYAQHVTEAASRLNGMFKVSDYPTPGEIERKFGMDTHILPMPDEADFRVSALGAGDLEAIKADIRTRINAEVAAAARDPWDRIYNAVSHMAGKLREFGKDETGKATGTFRDSLVNNLRDLVNILPSLNITGDGELEAMRQELAATLCKNDAQSLRESPGAREATAKAADEILEKMKGYTNVS